MAKTKFGQGITEMRGSVGGVVYSRNRYGAYARAKVSPVQPLTEAQAEQREKLRIVSNAWRLLDENQRKGWMSWALSYVDVFGDAQTYSGQVAFIKINLAKLSASEPLISDVPFDKELADMPSVINFHRTTLSEMEVSFAPDPLVGDIRVFVRMTAPLSVGVTFNKNLFRLVAVSDLNQAGRLDVKEVYEDVFGSAPETAAEWNAVKIGLHIQVYKAANGLLSPGVRSVITGVEEIIPVFPQ